MTSRKWFRAALLATLAALVWGPPAFSSDDEAGPNPFPHNGNGMFSRNVPILPQLPPDRKRDVFYQNRWYDAHRPPNQKHIDSLCDGGLYGRRWPTSCTQSVAPFFQGSPGCSTIDEGCRPTPHMALRRLQNFVHPFKPVGMYYAGGSYVPIYDLDPVVPGPGPFPWSHFLQRCTGG